MSITKEKSKNLILINER